MLEAVQINFYLNNGYLLVPVFSKEECEEIQNIYEFHADKEYSTLMRLHETVPEIIKFMAHKKVVEVLDLLQSAVAGHRVKVDAIASCMFFKKPGTIFANQAWNPHQDSSYHQTKDGICLTTNIFLEDTDQENGCMYIYPGSQRESLINFEEVVSYKQGSDKTPGNKVIIPDKYTKVDLPASQGIMLVLNNNTIHGSYSNASKDRSRPMFSVTYCNQGESFAVGQNAQRKRVNVHNEK